LWHAEAYRGENIWYNIQNIASLSTSSSHKAQNSHQKLSTSMPHLALAECRSKSILTFLCIVSNRLYRSMQISAITSLSVLAQPLRGAHHQVGVRGLTVSRACNPQDSINTQCTQSSVAKDRASKQGHWRVADIGRCVCWPLCCMRMPAWDGYLNALHQPAQSHHVSPHSHREA
jgi:hypothetical protein